MRGFGLVVMAGEGPRVGSGARPMGRNARSQMQPCVYHVTHRCHGRSPKLTLDVIAVLESAGALDAAPAGSGLSAARLASRSVRPRRPCRCSVSAGQGGVRHDASH